MPIDFEAAERETAIAQGCERLWLFLNNLSEARRNWLEQERAALCEFDPSIILPCGEPAASFNEWAKRLYRFVKVAKLAALDRELCRAVCLANDIGTPPLKKAAWLFASAVRRAPIAEIAAAMKRQQDPGRILDAMSSICFFATGPHLLRTPPAPDAESIRSRCEQLKGRLKDSPGTGAKEFLFDAPDAIAVIWESIKQVDKRAPSKPGWAIAVEQASQRQLDGLLNGQAWWALADVEAALTEALAWCEKKMAKAEINAFGSQPMPSSESQAERLAGVGPESRAKHSTDYRSVNWFGTLYTFTPNQAACVKIWWEHWEQGTPVVGDETVLEAADSAAKRINAVFSDCPAWGVMIVPGSTKGTHRLQEPKN